MKYLTACLYVACRLLVACLFAHVAVVMGWTAMSEDIVTVYLFTIGLAVSLTHRTLK